MPKPPTKGVQEGVAHPKPAAPCITRSGTLAVTNGKTPVIQNGEKDSPSKEKQGDPPPTESTDEVTAKALNAFSTSLSTLQPIVEALNRILAGDGSTVDTIKWIFGYIRDMEKAEKQRKGSAESQEKVSDIHKTFREDIQNVCNYLANRMIGIENTVNATRDSSVKTLKVAEELKEKSAEILSNVGKVTNATVKIADTTQSYREALMSRPSPSNKASVDPKVLCDMERKDKQILIDIFDEEGANTLGTSLTELVAKANGALDSIKGEDKPEPVKVESAHKTKKNAILLTLNSKEAANWLREVENEVAFVNSFSKGAHIREREFNLVTPRVPLTFEPSNTKHLREIEENNNLPSHVIRKARWIKPEGCRRQGQTHAYAIVTVTSVDTANKMIRDGVNICGSHSRPSKQRIEPIQCMKCRRWGHFADSCPETEDTCGTCGEKHRTSACKSSDKVFCVSCADSTHPSWDRACPEFMRRCEIINETNPVNNMPFFPAEQDWTLSIRPPRIPTSERFPTTYAVNSLPINGKRNFVPRRRGPNRDTNPAHRNPNPNLIPIPEISRYAGREPGEVKDNSTPSWLDDPITGSGSWDNANTEGDVPQHLE